MSWWKYLVLIFLGLATVIVTASFQPTPGYMDADYYYAGSRQLISGQGFNEPYLWNYLDNPTGLPHPSHAYWMPLPSLLAAAGSLMFGRDSWWAARSLFLAIAACIPALTALLAWKLTSRSDLALTSGLLAVFPGYYLVLLPSIDSFGIYIFLGGIFLLLLTNKPALARFFFLGVIAGLMHLARADGILWLVLALVAPVMRPPQVPRRMRDILPSLVLPVVGYLLIMMPWFLRNHAVLGTFLAPGGSRMLWLTTYDQIFSFPADLITYQGWLQSGWMAILKARTWALGLNLANAFSVQGGMFLWPLGLIGAYQLRREKCLQFALLAWLLTLAVMTLVFPFAGARGGFLHSGAALQILWWVLVPIGLEKALTWGVQKRNWVQDQAGRILPVLTIALMLLVTIVITSGRLGLGRNPSWGSELEKYSQAGAYLAQQGIGQSEVVIISNPPGFWLASGHPAIALPDGDVSTLEALACRYNARVVILEEGSIPRGLLVILDYPDDFPALIHLGTMEDIHVFEIRP